MKKISDNIQGGSLMARIVGSGEVGILRTHDKIADNATYWNSKEDAISDLQAVIAYFKNPSE